jgi:hypothetical protein
MENKRKLIEIAVEELKKSEETSQKQSEAKQTAEVGVYIWNRKIK